MPDDRPSDERQREFEQIKQDLMRRGRGVAEAEAIAERTVSRQHTQAPLPSAAEAPSAHSYRELYAQAKARGIAGRSTMSKKELERRLAS
jgi:hypothetical protein